MINKLIRDINFKINLYRSYKNMDINRRDIKEVFLKKVEVENDYLIADRQDKDTEVLKARLDTLNWVLNIK